MIVTSATGTTTPASVLATASNWRDATTSLVGWLVANDRCFSSGEVAAYVRTFRPDLAFAVTRVGEYVRRWFAGDYDVTGDSAPASGDFPSYDDGAGNVLFPAQVPRTTVGTCRTLVGRTVTSKTPIGVTVFVYAKDAAEGFAHDFEVFIPDWDDPMATRALPPSPSVSAAATAATPAPAASTPAGNTVRPPTPAVAVVITGALKRDDLTAYVRPVDNRLCVPRAAFEAFVHLTGVPLRGGPNGDPVYINFNGTTVEITLGATPGADAYHLWSARGRVAFPAKVGSFTPGDKYEVKVSANALTIDLSVKV